MKKIFSSLIVAVVALSLGLGLGTANATWTVGHTLQTVLVTADSTQLTAVKGGTADPVYTLAAGESLAANDTIRIDLIGGAVWAAVPTLQPTTALTAADVGAGAGLAAVPLSAGAIGDTWALWRVIVAVPTGDTLALNSFATANFDVRPLVIGSNVDMTMTLRTNTDVLIGTVKSHNTVIGNYLFTGAAAETMALVARTDTADVSATTGAYLKFTGDTLVGTATTLTLTNDSVVAALPSSAAISAEKILVTLAGDFSGIDKVAGTGITGSDSAGDITDGTAGEFLINSANAHAYAVNTAAVTNAVGALAIAPTVTIDGTTAQAARSFTATVEVLVDGTTWDAHTAQIATTLYTVVRNGVSFVTTSVGQYNTIKVADRSGALPTAGGHITINAYDADGNVIDEVSGVTSLILLSNETLIISGPDLQARFVSSPMKYEFAIESPQAVVTNVKIHPNGGFSSTVYTNVGDGAL